MAIRRELQDLVELAAAQGDFWKAFLQSLADIGGSTELLNRIVANARGDREILKRWLRQLMPIWDLVGQREGLTVLFEFPIRDHESSMVTPVSIQSAALSTDGYSWSEDPPPAGGTFFEYRLHHFGEVQTHSGMRNHLPEGLVHAGWRELLAYLCLFTPESIEGGVIVAGGSYHLLNESYITDYDFTFPCARSEGDSIVVDSISIDDDQRRFGNEHFFLVRDYN